jgi:hypothetical protein
MYHKPSAEYSEDSRACRKGRFRSSHSKDGVDVLYEGKEKPKEI